MLAFMSTNTTSITAYMGAISDWHAHIYYDPARTRNTAATLRDKIAAAFPGAVIGRWHDALVGPHTQAMYQVAFTHDVFDRLVPFLALNRDGLTVLVHAEESGNSKAHHTDHAIWMGEVLAVKTAQWE
jgi:aromatic ring-cleaving dioxygenase